jgi:hypothetical protein
MFGIQFGSQTKAIPPDSRHDHWENGPPKGFLIVIKITPSSVRRSALPHRSNVGVVVLQTLFKMIRLSSFFHSQY